VYMRPTVTDRVAFLSHHTVVWGILSLLCVCLSVCLSVCLFVCTVTDFSAAEKVRGVKFCVRVRLLSGMSFSHFGEHWLAGNHGGGNSLRYFRDERSRAPMPTDGSRRRSLGIRNWVPWVRGAVGIDGGGVA